MKKSDLLCFAVYNTELIGSSCLMKKIVSFILFFSLITITTSANSFVRAYLAYDDYECASDHMVFETPQGYILAEWYSGTLLSPSYYYADFHNYGFAYVYDNEEDADNDENSTGYIYIEDYMEGNDSAAKWCFSE